MAKLASLAIIMMVKTEGDKCNFSISHIFLIVELVPQQSGDDNLSDNHGTIVQKRVKIEDCQNNGTTNSI